MGPSTKEFWAGCRSVRGELSLSSWCSGKQKILIIKPKRRAPKIFCCGLASQGGVAGSPPLAGGNAKTSLYREGKYIYKRTSHVPRLSLASTQELLGSLPDLYRGPRFHPLSFKGRPGSYSLEVLPLGRLPIFLFPGSFVQIFGTPDGREVSCWWGWLGRGKPINWLPRWPHQRGSKRSSL